MLKPMNDEQRKIAEENHELVIAFLRENNLPKDEFYSIVIFGYLCAVQEYCEKAAMKRFSLATLAWKRMRRELFNYQKYLSSNKNIYGSVSLNDYVGDSSGLRWEDLLIDKRDPFEELKTELILHDLAKKLSKLEMRIVWHKINGEKMHAIAKEEHMTFHDINLLLARIYGTVIKALQP